MSSFKFSGSDIRLHLQRNKLCYVSLLMCMILGVIIGIIIIASTENYLNIISSKNMLLYSFMNGTISTASIFWNQFFKFLVPMLVMFLLGMNYFSCFLCFVIITYQTALFTLSAGALISFYGVSGLFNSLLIMLPINLLYFLILIFFTTTLFERSKAARKFRNFSEGYSSTFFIKVLASFLGLVLLCTLAGIIYPIILKSAIFIIF